MVNQTNPKTKKFFFRVNKLLNSLGTYLLFSHQFLLSVSHSLKKQHGGDKTGLKCLVTSYGRFLSFSNSLWLYCDYTFNTQRIYICIIQRGGIYQTLSFFLQNLKRKYFCKVSQEIVKHPFFSIVIFLLKVS